MSERAGPWVGGGVLVLGAIIWFLSLGHPPATQATPTTSGPAHHRQVVTTSDRASSWGEAVGNALQRLFGGDQATSPPTTTKPRR